MKLIILWALTLVGCATTGVFERSGYNQGPYSVRAKNCHVPVKFQAQLDSSRSSVIGRISAGDPGLGFSCQEDFVLEQFQRDACSVKANLVNITEEQQPDFFSTCYRAKAELVKVSGRGKIVSDARYSSEKVLARAAKGRDLTTKAMSAGMANSSTLRPKSKRVR